MTVDAVTQLLRALDFSVISRSEQLQDIGLHVSCDWTAAPGGSGDVTLRVGGEVCRSSANGEKCTPVTGLSPADAQLAGAAEATVRAELRRLPSSDAAREALRRSLSDLVPME